jgi:hypothetical protein
LDILVTLPISVQKKRHDYDNIKDDLERLESSSRTAKPRRSIKPSLPDKRHFEHWDRLSRVAEDLRLALEIPAMNNYATMDSRIDGTAQGRWTYNRHRVPRVHFSAEERALWPYFLEHITTEFEGFADDVKRVRSVIARSVRRENYSDTYDYRLRLRRTPAVRALREKLDLIIERRTFEGTCRICQPWQ